MRTNFQKKLLTFTRILELFIALLIVIAVIFSVLSLVWDLFDFTKSFKSPGAFSLFLGYAFNTIIGIEFLKMILKHSTSAVIEVLLFAIARQLIVEHTTSLENLLGILAIAVLFIVRKFLYVSTFDEDEINKSDMKFKFWNKLKRKKTAVLNNEEKADKKAENNEKVANNEKTILS